MPILRKLRDSLAVRLKHTATERVLRAFVAKPGHVGHSASDLRDEAHVWNIDPILGNLQDAGVLRAEWEETGKPGPRRRLYYWKEGNC